jgi:hypothetical protein
MQAGYNITAVAREPLCGKFASPAKAEYAIMEQLCGKFAFPAKPEYAIMEETSSVGSVPGLYNEYH